ncbi:MAG TPA: ATP-dependent Clp protease adapter ClpS [Arcobacter sp.]|nr:ATP-dependent Clp protease adapter ClpS [Arcobacter sp.]
MATHFEYQTENELEVSEPKKYKVLLLNDDYSTMEFVVEILKTIFKKNEEEATQIMLNVHETGKGVCGMYTYEIAATKVEQVKRNARRAQFPLKAIMEEE